MFTRNRKPNLNNLLRVLRCEAPDRSTLFEFSMNIPLYEIIANRKEHYNSYLDIMKVTMDAYCNAGEESYKQRGGRIAILGGIDVGFLVSASY